ncbi:hypothetical protein [Algiphilus sp.]|uniref:hypothetical protein n=1 Tax=Algiphilus sp. TaxID=1872431 RepID=UPI003BABB7E5
METRDEAAREGAIATLLAKVASTAANQADDADDTNTTQSLSTKQQDGCVQISESIEDVGSPFAETLAVTTTTADDCRDSGEGNGVSLSSRQDGIIAVGEAENGNVTYIRASDISGDPASGGPYILQFESNFGGQTTSQDVELRGELNLCDNCASPTQGGNLELIGYLSSSFAGNDLSAFSSAFGTGPNDPATIIINEGAQTTETRIDGPFEFSDNDSCDVSTDYETLDPIITDNSTGQVQSGRLNVTVDGESFEIVYNGDGSVTVNGRTYTAQELATLNDACTAALEEASQAAP